LLELITWVMVTFLILGTLIMLGYGPLPRSVLDMILAVLLLFGLGFGAGTLLGITEAFVPSIANVMKVPMRLLYFLSGAFFLPDAMPPAIRDVLAWNPVLHGITLFRHGYYPRYDSHMLDVQYLAFWSMGCVFAALLMIRLTQKPLRNLA
jgi:capsular polysaccharide transport system permease protein